MLIVFGGLPGTGKTTLARELARLLSATYLRIDSIEQAIIGGRIVGPRPCGLLRRICHRRRQFKTRARSGRGFGESPGNHA